MKDNSNHEHVLMFIERLSASRGAWDEIDQACRRGPKGMDIIAAAAMDIRRLMGGAA